MKSQNTTPVSAPPPQLVLLSAIAHKQKEDGRTLAFSVEDRKEAAKRDKTLES